MLNTYAKLGEFTEREWVQQPGRREWLLIAEEKRKLRMIPGAPFHKRWVRSHAGNRLEAAADKQAKQGAQMAYLPRETFTPEGDLEWTFARRATGTLGGVKKALKRQAQDDDWGAITREPGQGARLTYLRNAGVSKEALVKGGRFAARLLTSTLPPRYRHYEMRTHGGQTSTRGMARRA